MESSTKEPMIDLEESEEETEEEREFETTWGKKSLYCKMILIMKYFINYFTYFLLNIIYLSTSAVLFNSLETKT